MAGRRFYSTLNESVVPNLEVPTSSHPAARYLVVEDAVRLLPGRVDELHLAASEADQEGGRVRRALRHAEVVTRRTRALVHPLVDWFGQIHCLWW